MITGHRQFEGKTVLHVVASVLKTEPDWTSLPTTTPAPLVRLLRRCLEKEPRRRLRDIGEAVIQLEGAAAEPAVEHAPRTVVTATAPGLPGLRKALSLALVIGSLMTGLGVWTATRPAAPPVTRFVVSVDSGIPPTQSLAFSHDGETVVYAVRVGGPLYRRALDQLEGVPIPGTEGAVSGFFSPDDEWVGFFAVPDLKKVALAGGPPMTLVESARGTAGFGGATWGANDTIVFSRVGEGLWQVPAVGGGPQQLTTPDSDQGETLHLFPEFISGTESVLFQASGSDGAHQISVQFLTTGERRVLVPSDRPRHASTGHLVFARGESLWRAPFDDDSLEIGGEPFPVLEGVLNSGAANAAYDVSASGSLAYAPGGAVATPQRTLVWIDRDGNEEMLAAPPRAYMYPRISPDGARVAIEDFVSGSDADLGVGLHT